MRNVAVVIYKYRFITRDIGILCILLQNHIPEAHICIGAQSRCVDNLVVVRCDN